ncbi:pyocin activator PrtN family protein [Ralstonia wenshanensis]|uniref:pyocin activator PrtN family protein n=1 Tax=Ralstonia wenshanensis TaxID=2842456 RepID=UPI002AACD992|nr:pyocin activator PrtN family protein [Ralstonia wenshanensis]MDY7507213.1 pyocin activator PrtN family protein [Ralstonia wenshanensis]
MNTTFLLLAQYGAMAIVPLEVVARDYFSHLTPEKLLRKISAGDIALPLIRMEGSQKTAKGVHVKDLATYIDSRRAAACKECAQLAGNA